MEDHNPYQIQVVMWIALKGKVLTWSQLLKRDKVGPGFSYYVGRVMKLMNIFSFTFHYSSQV
jgi:hypothetical protein